MFDRTGIKWAAADRQEETRDGGILGVVRPYKGVVCQEGFMRPSSQIDDALLLPFPHHLHVAVPAVQVDVFRLEIAQLAQAKSCVKQRHNFGVVARNVGRPCIDRNQQALDFLVRQGLNGQLRLLRTRQQLKDIHACIAFLGKPGRKALERTDVLINGGWTHRLRARGLVRVVLIAGRQFEVGDVGDDGISREVREDGRLPHALFEVTAEMGQIGQIDA